ncbi:cupin domain-containing protein [Paenibacillus sp. F411]|uniref:Cupin domain-containing protein n=1 Tax=Paenibacillus algicola TaxID=2565926 RepID=A0A4V1G4H9_9BACL|nr:MULTISPECIES: cupin domain-containing protein [Paenibacillus]MBO2944612.1 cupin domain-containing protein [Paenibacillus sp. F411]QCT04754.1 Cupin domain-containing protein [Paenibacillus algicola]
MDTPIQSFYVHDDGEVPNHPELPVMVYKGVFQDGALSMEAAFKRHGWSGSWSGGIYEEHHYHSNTHEVLGVKAGSATVLVGGDAGQRLELLEGDVLVIPAGVAHKKLESSFDFEVTGAYPNGASPNLRKRDPAQRAQSISEIQNVPIPDQDPVFGEEGPLLHKWVK